MQKKVDSIAIRQERQADQEAVYRLVTRAFETAEQSDGNEQDLVNALRKSDAFVPELSLVAVLGEEIIGHIMFTELKVIDYVALALAPLSVLPKYQRSGVGSSLVEEGHRIARALGYGYSVVLGSDAYYPRFGYVPAERFGIHPCFDVSSKNFMACKLRDDAPAVSGVVKYADEFGIG